MLVYVWVTFSGFEPEPCPPRGTVTVYFISPGVSFANLYPPSLYTISHYLYIVFYMFTYYYIDISCQLYILLHL